MKSNLPLLALLCCALFPVERVLADDEQHSPSIGTSVQNGWVTVVPPEFHGAINNPLKGFRAYKTDGYGLVERKYIKWNDIEVCADDSVERIIAHTKKITETQGKRFEDLNVKLVPRVYLDWNGTSGKQHWPADLHTFDYDTFANLSREPPNGPKDQFPWQATYVYPALWKRAPIEGEVEYNWQKQRESAKPEETFGRTSDETLTVPAYRRFMIDKIRRYHASYLGWIDNYNASNREVLVGAADLQKAFGYRFVLDSASYPLAVPPGEKLTVKLTVRYTGSAPFYLDWPVAVGLLDPATKKPVWSAPLAGVDIRKWLPGEDWDSAVFAYRRPAVPHHHEGHATVTQHIKPGQYLLALAILDRQGGMMPSARFAIGNYFRGGWHPLGFIGIGEAPEQATLKDVKFDSPAFDDSLYYKVPEKLLAVKVAPVAQVKAVTPWTPDPNTELINPWRYWILNTPGNVLEKQILTDGPSASRVIRVTGDFGGDASLNYTLGSGIKLDRGRYRFAFRVRGTPGQSVEFELADGWSRVSKEARIPLAEQWQKHTIEFEIKTKFQDETALRFRLPRDTKGTFDLADTRLKRMAALHGAATPKPASKPNILILLADDMGYGDPGCYNPKSKIATPHIDRLAREGMRFTDAHAPGPLCHPSRYGLMTGRYPFRTDISRWPKQPLIEEGQMTIASLLKSQGYRTAMVGKWHLGFLEDGYDKPLPGGPVACGFDTYFGLRASTDIPPYFFIRGDRAVTPPTDHIAEHHSQGWSSIQGEFWRAGGLAPGMALKDVLPRLTEEALHVIDSQGRANQDSRKPFLLYFAPTAPHTPWLPAPEFAGKSAAGMYGDFTMMVDAEIGRILAALDQSGLAKDTLVLFTSDNGPVWHEADVQRLGHASAGGWRGMKSDAWESGHRMPFIARWPGRVKAGTVSEQTICFTDLLATFAEICGATLPNDAGPDSFSFLQVLEGVQPADQPIRAPIVMQAGSAASMMMIRSGDWKLINGLGSGGFTKPSTIKPKPGEPAVQLYNLRTDPAETTNLAAKHPDKVKELLSAMQANVERGRSR